MLQYFSEREQGILELSLAVQQSRQEIANKMILRLYESIPEGWQIDLILSAQRANITID